MIDVSSFSDLMILSLPCSVLGHSEDGRGLDFPNREMGGPACQDGMSNNGKFSLTSSYNPLPNTVVRADLQRSFPTSYRSRRPSTILHPGGDLPSSPTPYSSRKHKQYVPYSSFLSTFKKYLFNSLPHI
jgi:hypothetical protein